MRCTFLLLIISMSCSDAAKTLTVVKPLEEKPFIATYGLSDISKSNSFTEGSVVCNLSDIRFREASGMAASQVNAGLIYIEEDSGNPNQIQLVDKNCNTVAAYTIGNSNNRDWEDLALASSPVSNVSYVYVADIGDNKLQYPTKIIYRFEEPSVAGKSLPINATISSGDKIEVKLPDTYANAETLLVDPLTQDIYIVTKDNTASVYVARYPQDLTKTITLTKIAVLPFFKVTAGDISPDGNEIVLKTTDYIVYWKKSGNESISELFKILPSFLPYTVEQQGEAICFASDGSGYYTTSERPDPTLDQPIYFYKRK